MFKLGFSKRVFSLLALFLLGSVLALSLWPNPIPLRKEFTAPLPKPTAKLIRKSYPEVRHFPIYLVLAVVVQVAFVRTKRQAALVILGLLVLSALLEVVQKWIPHRTADFRDFLWSAMGILLGSLPWVFKRPSLPKET